MEENKKKGIVDSGIENYFKESIDTLLEDLEKNQKLYDRINKQIESFENYQGKGGAMVLTEHFKNMISLNTQSQSLKKDIFSIKKAILDYTNKNNKDENSEVLISKMYQILRETKKEDFINPNDFIVNHEDLDAQIDEMLDEEEE